MRECQILYLVLFLSDESEKELEIYGNKIKKRAEKDEVVK